MSSERRALNIVQRKKFRYTLMNFFKSIEGTGLTHVTKLTEKEIKTNAIIFGINLHVTITTNFRVVRDKNLPFVNR